MKVDVLVSEFLRNHSRLLAATAVLSLGASACAGNTASTASHDSVKVDIPTPLVTPNIIYFENGTREIDQISKAGDHPYYSLPVFEYCDGRDLIDQTIYQQGYGNLTSSTFNRSVDHPACDDGKVTPADFVVKHG